MPLALSGLILFFLPLLSCISSLAMAEPYSEFAPKNNLTFDFQSIDVRTLLQLIAKNAGLNFVISDAVKGTISLNLKNVSWQEALNIVLQAHGLASRREGNVVFISTVEELTSNQTKTLQSAESIANLAPLSSVIIHLKYENAEDLAKLLKGSSGTLLTPRGQLAVDSRTNSVIIRDIKTNLNEITRAIHQLDIPAKQVLIEARIVTINVQFEKNLGARFGLTKPNWMSGTYQGASSMPEGNSPALITNAAGTVDPTQRLIFNNPAAALFNGGTPGSIAMAIAKIGGTLVDMELSALEGEEHLQMLASPRVMASNQQKAYIATGVEIPYQESTSSGATSVSFKDAVLSLEITPQITPDNKIILSVKATQNSEGTPTVTSATAGSTATSIPSINTNEVQSSVLLNNNETVVLGGIYQDIKTNSVQRLPFFGTLPLIGALFRTTSTEDQKQELLIFLTPKIISTHSIAKLNGTPLKGEG